MKFQLKSEDLRDGLSTVMPAVAKKSTLPVLSNVMIKASDGSVRFVATNLDITLSKTVPATVENQGSVTLPARMLSDYVAQLNGETVQFDLAPKSLKMNFESGRYKANLAGLDAENFPTEKSTDGEGVAIIHLPSKVLKDAINRIEYAAAPDGTRPVLAGVLFHASGKTLTMAGADGFRLAVTTVELAEASECKAIIPAKLLREVQGLLDDCEDDVTISVSEKVVAFTMCDSQAVGRPIEGDFPAYQRIIPEKSSTSAVMDRSLMLKSAKVASVFARDNSNIVRVACTSGKVTVSAKSAENGDTGSDIDATVDGDDIEMFFNGRYLADALEAIGGSSIQMGLTTSKDPCVLRPVGDQSYTAVIMPMNPPSAAVAA